MTSTTQPLSSRQLLSLALIPGKAEGLARAGNATGNLAWVGLAKGVIWARNGVYIGAALMILSLVGLHFATSTSLLLIGKGMTLLGLAATSLFSVRLDQAVFLVSRFSWPLTIGLFFW